MEFDSAILIILSLSFILFNYELMNLYDKNDKKYK